MTRNGSLRQIGVSEAASGISRIHTTWDGPEAALSRASRMLLACLVQRWALNQDF